VERGVAFLAVPALLRAMARAPEAGTVRMELVSALEAEARHAEAVEVLGGSNATEQWTGRYLLVFNSLMAGDIDGAQPVVHPPRPAAGAAPGGDGGAAGRDARRVAAAAGVELFDEPVPVPADPHDTLGAADLRGWHFALNGGLLTTLSPYGADAGMNGRYAYLAETYASCHWALRRLAASSRRPGGARRPWACCRTGRAGSSGSPRRRCSASGLGLAAADGGRARRRVLLSDAAPHVAQRAVRRAGADPRRARDDWTDPPPVAADLTTFLHQVVVPPWAARQLPAPDGDGWARRAAGPAPEREIAAEILAAPAVPDPGDGSAPEDPDAALTRSPAGWRACGRRAGPPRPGLVAGPGPQLTLLVTVPATLTVPAREGTSA
jgi:hypothetical protein